MNYRRFGRTDWRISEVGFGMWAMGGQWSGSDDEESLRALRRAVELKVNFFDTAWAYGDGRSERILGKLLRELPGQKLYVATKVPPMNLVWPARPQDPVRDVFPPDHLRRYAEKSLANLGVGRIDLLQVHVWDDGWAADTGWQRAVEALKKEAKIAAFGISVNRWEPANVIRALRTGLVDVVQVIYNVFDQAPEDELFPVCRELDVAVIARVPFDEGTLTGTLTRETRFAPSDWRSRYFTPENLLPSVERAERLMPLLAPGMKLPEMALRFILSEPTVSTTIPGMRKISHVEANVAAGDGRGLPADLRAALRSHRWDRKPAPWSA
jgi:aryl-alcohol dehydrogenase-like predicted oxidoreductase